MQRGIINGNECFKEILDFPKTFFFLHMWVLLWGIHYWFLGFGLHNAGSHANFLICQVSFLEEEAMTKSELCFQMYHLEWYQCVCDHVLQSFIFNLSNWADNRDDVHGTVFKHQETVVTISEANQCGANPDIG